MVFPPDTRVVVASLSASDSAIPCCIVRAYRHRITGTTHHSRTLGVKPIATVVLVDRLIVAPIVALMAVLPEVVAALAITGETTAPSIANAAAT